ncbi:MAG: TonB-dependent receptor [Woeseia sp.]|nr:TonB-dependent receptor [Woeseia sp.]MBT8096367.1 TonB-dependent receptor [Woeseia sp.]NNE61457.1 TonB-dependent receptor [Woeseia sp.]
MRSKSFNKTPLATGIAIALGAAAASPVSAQDEVIEEVVVTGIRGSLIQSMDRKRDAKGVVDAISAEDIGKFPDQNLAESLQRITGVSIDRSNNEGSQITVRGMGPEFNLVTLNGRSMPTAGGRSFDFADIASEGVSAVEVYKTAKANLPTGGIGATVNIITSKPLEAPGMRSVVSAKAVHETSSSNSSVASLDEFTPEISGMYSNTFADDTIGIRVSASYQERDNREENAEVAFWVPNGQLTDADINGPNVTNNNQRADGVWWHPQNIGYGWADISRDRLNSQLVLQYAPTDRITATLDYTYSEVEFEKDANSTGIWFECPNVDAVIDERGTVTQVSQACGDYSTNVARDHTKKENGSLGLNLEYMVNDGLTLALDMHSSSSELKGAGVGDEPTLSSANLIIGNTSCGWCDPNAGFGNPTATISNQTAFYPASGIPTFDVSFAAPDGSPQPELLRSDLGSLFGQAFDDQTYNDILQVQLSGSWENLDSGALRRINFGYTHTEQEYKNLNTGSGLLPAGFWLTSAQYWPDDVWQQGNLGGLLSGFSNGGNFSYDPYFTVGYDTAVDFYETIGVGDPIGGVYWDGWGPEFQDTANSRGRFWSGPSGQSSFVVDENIESFFTQMVFEDEFNGMALNAVIGLRYEDTEMTSYGKETLPTAINWTGGNEFGYVLATAPNFRRGDGKNDFWLPSLDLDIEVYEGVIGRFSFSRSIARPPIGNLTPNRSFPSPPNIRSRLINSGNPDLLPYVSDNFDLSVEWYYADGSYASVGWFKKKVDNFLVTETTQETFAGILDVYRGAEAELARAQLITEGTSPDDQAVFARINENRGAPVGAAIDASPGDPLVIFDRNQTENAEVGNLFGWEFALQHLFVDSGFGVQANLTIVNGDVNADRDVINQQFALPGLSDSANLTVFYENDLVSARLAYNWRDEFLSGFDANGGPVFTEEYAPLDFNLTYYATDNLAVFFEAINITEEVQRSYVRYPEQFVRGNEYGARFNIGARYNFD